MILDPIAVSSGLTLIFILCIYVSFVSIIEFNYAVANNDSSTGDKINKNNFTVFDSRPSFSTNNAHVLINTTSLSNCILKDEGETQNKDSDYSSSLSKSSWNNNNNGICKVFSFSDPITCFKYFATNQSKIPCETSDSAGENIELDRDNFGEKGYLLADTKFDNQYSFEVIDPLVQDKKFRVTMDFNEHTQSENNDINSPRLEIVRENLNGLPDMSAAKNQEIIWTGNILDYFEEPEDDFANETYIAIQFNTGRHGSGEPEEERGFGVLFDVSGSNNPNLFEYRDDGKYVKYDYNMTKQLAGNSFVFHHLDRKSQGPLFVDNLTNTENVKLKVRTFLTDNDTRIVETFIGNDSSGIEIPYWTLNNLSKLKGHEDVEDERGFMETVNQGSGYVIARTDNIDTRPSSFQSFIFNE